MGVGAQTFYSVILPGSVVNTWSMMEDEVSVTVYTIHNKLSNFLCFASFSAHLCAISNNFKCNDENRILGKMKPRIYRRHPLNRHMGRAILVGGVSKQN